MKTLKMLTASFAVTLTLFQSVSAQNNLEKYFAELTVGATEDFSTPGGLNAPGSLGIGANRYSDDGSAAIVDDSGVILWKLSNGSVRALPNTGKSKPLFVSNTQCIVWRNAFEQFEDLRSNCVVTYFQINSATNEVVEASGNLYGNVVLDTPIVSLSNKSYTVVTSHVITQPGVESSSDGENRQNLYIYRLPTDVASIQRLGSYRFTSSGSDADIDTFEGAVESIATLAASVDGSYVLQINDEFLDGLPGAIETLFVWVTPDGKATPIFSPNDEFVVEQLARPELNDPGFFFEGNLFHSLSIDGVVPTKLRVVDLNATSLKLGADNTSNFIYSYTRSLNLDIPATQQLPALDLSATPAGEGGSVVALPTNAAQLPGEKPLFLVKRTSDLSLVDLYRLNGDVLEYRFNADLPEELYSGLTSVIADTSVGTEAVAVYDPSNRGVVWLHEGNGVDFVNGGAATTNFSLIDESEGAPIIASSGELLIWNNAYASRLPGAAKPVILVDHYGRDGVGGVLETAVTVSYDAQFPNLPFGSPLRGEHIIPPSPFVSDPLLWYLESFEVTGPNSSRILRYTLLSRLETDGDGDGILTGLEEGPFYVIPGNFSYDEAVADAARRGGVLASIADIAEFNAMQSALSLWSTQSRPLVFPLPRVPYPLWIGLANSGGWEWTDGTNDGFIAGNWAPGEPSAVAGRTSGQLTDTQQWQAANPANTGSYLLKLPVTDPASRDTDADGGSDYDELFRLITDPITANFGAGPTAIAVDFEDPLVNGTYEGYVTDLTNGPVAAMQIKVSNKGKFSCRLTSADTSAIIKGQLLPNGTASFIPIKFKGFSTESMLSAKLVDDANSGAYRIQGRITGGIFNSGAPTVIELRRAGYNRIVATADAGAYTVALPPAVKPAVGEPTGFGYLTASVGSDGRATMMGMTADGQKLKWSGYVVEGDFMSYFGAIKKPGGITAGNLFFRQFAKVDPLLGIVGESDIDGDVLQVSNSGSRGPGYFMRSLARGSRYYKRSFYQVPAFNEIPVGPGNVVVEFDESSFGSAPIVGTWNQKSSIELPKTQTHQFRARVNTKNGVMKGKYTYANANSGYATTKSKINGVVLQKSGEVLGGYIVGASRTGPVKIMPNIDDSPLIANRVAPRSKSVDGGGGLYQVYVTTNERWTAIIDPTSGTSSYTGNPLNWLTITPGNGAGSGVVTILVAANNGSSPRSADIMIAGIRHTVSQEYGGGPGQGGGGSNYTAISPSSNTVAAPANSYLVRVSNYDSEASINPDFDFFSLVDWVTVDYTPGSVDPSTGLGRGIALITVAENTAFQQRSTSITIAGLTHRIVQGPASTF